MSVCWGIWISCWRPCQVSLGEFLICKLEGKKEGQLTPPHHASCSSRYCQIIPKHPEIVFTTKAAETPKTLFPYLLIKNVTPWRSQLTLWKAAEMFKGTLGGLFFSLKKRSYHWRPYKNCETCRTLSLCRQPLHAKYRPQLISFSCFLFLTQRRALVTR